jgi:hypothetical protein
LGGCKCGEERAMKIGLVMPNVYNGYIMSEAAPQCKPDFEYDREIVQNLRVATYMAAAVSRTRQTPSPRSSTPMTTSRASTA